MGEGIAIVILLGVPVLFGAVLRFLNQAIWCWWEYRRRYDWPPDAYEGLYVPTNVSNGAVPCGLVALAIGAGGLVGLIVTAAAGLTNLMNVMGAMVIAPFAYFLCLFIPHTLKGMAGAAGGERQVEGAKRIRGLSQKLASEDGATSLLALYRLYWRAGYRFENLRSPAVVIRTEKDLRDADDRVKEQEAQDKAAAGESQADLGGILEHPIADDRLREKAGRLKARFDVWLGAPASGKGCLVAVYAVPALVCTIFPIILAINACLGTSGGAAMFRRHPVQTLLAVLFPLLSLVLIYVLVYRPYSRPLSLGVGRRQLTILLHVVCYAACLLVGVLGTVMALMTLDEKPKPDDELFLPSVTMVLAVAFGFMLLFAVVLRLISSSQAKSLSQTDRS